MTGVQTCALPICFPVTISTLENLAKLFEKAMRLSYKIGGSDIFRIPGSERKRPINMALFESFGYFFSKLDESAVCDSCKEKLFELFKDNSFMMRQGRH